MESSGADPQLIQQVLEAAERRGAERSWTAGSSGCSPCKKGSRLRKRWRLCTCSCACCLLPMVIPMRLLSSALHDCGMRLTEMSAGSGSLNEVVALSLHWMGVRTVSMLTNVMPAYWHVHWAAQAHPEGSPRRCAVTIDDGISGNGSKLELLLDLFDEHGVNATFFIIANNNTMSGNGPRMVRKIVAAGHEIANHGISGEDMWQMAKSRFRTELLEWESRMRSILPRWPARNQDWKWFRPARGLMSRDMALVLADEGYEAVIGDVYTNDAQIPNNPDYHTKLILGATCDGSVLVFHEQIAETLDIMKSALPRLRERGFSFMRLTDMFSKENGFWGYCGAGLVLRAFLFLAIVVPCLLCCSVCGKAAISCARRCFAKVRGRPDGTSQSQAPKVSAEEIPEQLAAGDGLSNGAAKAVEEGLRPEAEASGWLATDAAQREVVAETSNLQEHQLGRFTPDDDAEVVVDAEREINENSGLAIAACTWCSANCRARPTA